MSKLHHTVRQWTEAALRLLYPPRCLLCRAALDASNQISPCCRECQGQAPLAGMYCPCCGCFSRNTEECCPACRPLRSLFALSFYQGEWRKMLHRLKYQGQRQLSRPLGDWLGTALLETGWAPDLVVFIPLHPFKASQRGYNQSQLIACRVAKVLGLPLIPALKKVKDTPSQTGLSRGDRSKNVAGAFAINRAFLPGKTALLVDDIYTTGATMKEAAAVLSRSGIVVYGAVAAFQVHP